MVRWNDVVLGVESGMGYRDERSGPRWREREGRAPTSAGGLVIQIVDHNTPKQIENFANHPLSYPFLRRYSLAAPVSLTTRPHPSPRLLLVPRLLSATQLQHYQNLASTPCRFSSRTSLAAPSLSVSCLSLDSVLAPAPGTDPSSPVTAASSVPELRFAVADRTAIPPAEQRLIFGPHQLEHGSLADYGLAAGHTVNLALRLRGGGKKRCGAMLDPTQRCSQAAINIVGQCNACEVAYCGKHRLPEDHKCSGLEQVRKAAHDKLATKMMSERTTGRTIESF